MKTPADKEIAFTFGSHPMADIKMRWGMRIVFPAGSDENTILEMTVLDGESEPVKEGVFEFAGQKLEVKDGKAHISYADFIKGKSSVALWLYRKGMPPVSGGLTFA